MPRLVQLSPGAAPHDATLSLMLGLAQRLRRPGGFATCDLIARFVPDLPRIKQPGIRGSTVHRLESTDLRKYSAEDVLVYHHGIASDAEAHLRLFPGRKFLVHHGITPPRFFVPYNLTIAGRLERGRRELQRFTPLFERAYCFSGITEAELREAGYLNVRKVDPPLPAAALQQRRLEDPQGDPVILSVGRMVPNKNHEPLIRMLHYLRGLHANARLILTGSLRNGLDDYTRHLQDMCRALRLQDAVEFSGLVDTKRMEELWQQSTHYVCSSLHEGYCLPLIEGMLRDRPVIYLNSSESAARETTDGAGIGLYPLEPQLLAELISEIHTNDTLRTSIIEGQRKRLEKLRCDGLAEDLIDQLAPMGGLDD